DDLLRGGQRGGQRNDTEDRERNDVLPHGFAPIEMPDRHWRPIVLHKNSNARIEPTRPAGMLCQRRIGRSGAYHAAKVRAAGKARLTVAPLPTALLMVRRPSCSSVNDFANGRPSPVPSYLRLRRPSTWPNGVIALSMSSGAMPMPVSDTQTVRPPFASR